MVGPAEKCSQRSRSLKNAISGLLLWTLWPNKFPKHPPKVAATFIVEFTYNCNYVIACLIFLGQVSQPYYIVLQYWEPAFFLWAYSPKDALKIFFTWSCALLGHATRRKLLVQKKNVIKCEQVKQARIRRGVCRGVPWVKPSRWS